MKYRVVVTATAEVEEVWEIEADSEDQVHEIVEEGLLHEHKLLEDRILGNERDRVVDRMEPAT